MIVINLFGGPGAGKTTLAYYLTYMFKKHGYLAEFVGEAARENHIYDSTPGVVPPQLLDNQPLLAVQQYERLKRLERHRVHIAITDSPLAMSPMYCENLLHLRCLDPMVRNLNYEFDNINVIVNRKPGVYNPESRVQRTEAEAIVFDEKVFKYAEPVGFTVDWGGEEKLFDSLLRKIS